MARVLVNLITPSPSLRSMYKISLFIKHLATLLLVLLLQACCRWLGKLSRHYSITPPTEPLLVTLSLVKILHLNT